MIEIEKNTKFGLNSNSINNYRFKSFIIIKYYSKQYKRLTKKKFLKSNYKSIINSISKFMNLMAILFV